MTITTTTAATTHKFTDAKRFQILSLEKLARKNWKIELRFRTGVRHGTRNVSQHTTQRTSSFERFG